MVKILTYLITLCFLFACSQRKTDRLKSDENELFTVLSKDYTGITFNNKLEENTYLNGFVYEYYYNGAGVAVADFNNDGLKDIYFVSNRRANSLYLNKRKLKFRNVTKSSNTGGKFGFPTGVTIVDINNDGLMDIYISKSGRIEQTEHLRNELLVNQGISAKGIPVFKESAGEYGLDLPYNSTQASFFDYDKDGDLDMFLINHGIDIYNENTIEELMLSPPANTGERLYRNDRGKFTEVTKEAGIISNPLAFTLGISIGDVNNDGWPDIFTGNDYSEKDHLYINSQDGTFIETSLDSFGHISNFSMGNDMADINNDGLLDIMTVDMTAEDNYTQKTSMSGMNVDRFFRHTDLGLHHQYMYNALHLNNGPDPKTGIPLFSNIEQLAGVSSTDWSWAPLLFDMNNDGLKDIFVSNGVKRDFRNNDFKHWHEEHHNKKREAALAQGYLDKDAYMAEVLSKLPARKRKNYFFLNSKNLTFDKVNITQPATNSNGAAYSDFDNDGDIDIVVNNSDDKAFIYRNNTKSCFYIKIKLKGPKKNPNAIGTRVEIVAKGNRQIQENYFTRGFLSAMADDLHFGLGEIPIIDSLKIQWPNGMLQYKTNIAANQTVEIQYQPKDTNRNNKKVKYLFEDITYKSKIDFTHKENTYNDFEKESLIPHKMSKLGPGLAIADVNNDGMDDFYVGGAKGQTGALYLQSADGRFKTQITVAFESDSKHEDTGALFFDVDNDEDQDLYVVSGGNEEAPGSPFYIDRLYINTGSGLFIKSRNAIPEIVTSGSKVTAGDYDNDGDLDLFIGSRVMPMNYGQYSKSYILKNQSRAGEIKFVDVTDSLLPELVQHIMVTDALWVDMNNDRQLDLVIANEWGPIELFENEGDKFTNATSRFGLDQQIGWWYSIHAEDIDNDGDMDLIAGNLGLNYKYKATHEEPFHLYINDFDDNQTSDIVLGYHQASLVYPVRGRECTSNQMPFVKEKFPTYNDFGKASLQQVYGEKLENSTHYAATNFASCILENMQNTRFEFKPLDNSIQISSINKIIVSDFDDDGQKDMVLLGNLYSSEVETPRNDASYGHFMKGSDEGIFEIVPSVQSGLYVKGDVKEAVIISLGAGKNRRLALLIARNDDKLMLLKINHN